MVEEAEHHRLYKYEVDINKVNNVFNIVLFVTDIKQDME